MLYPPGPQLGIAEGIETALSARRIFEVPVWAAMSAGGVRDFSIIPGVKFLRIFADHDEAGLTAAQICAQRYSQAGVVVEIRYPSLQHTDWNDFLTSEVNNAN
jgi:phage/plasmid primase-like uncharacterized protein